MLDIVKQNTRLQIHDVHYDSTERMQSLTQSVRACAR